MQLKDFCHLDDGISRRFGTWMTQYHYVSLIFVLSIAFACSLFNGYASRQYVRYLVASDVEQTLSYYSSQITHYPEKLSQLASVFEFNCLEQDRRQLQQLTYHDYLIRRMRLQLPDGRHCNSMESIEPERQLLPLVSSLREGVRLWVANEAHSNEQLLVVEKHVEKGKLLVYLEPLISDSLRDKYCTSCLLVAVSAELNPTVVLMRGDISLLQNPPLMSFPLIDRLTVKVYVQSALMDSYRQAFWLPLFLMGVFLGGAILAGHRLIQSRKLSLHALVDEGLAKQEFIPFYQPIVDVASNTLYGCEMLARWQRPDNEMISPMEFIPYVEKSGQIFPITDQLITKAVNEISKLNWQQTQQVLSINVIPDHLESHEIMEKSLALLYRSQISPRQIAFEVTERKQFTDLAMASDVIDLLRSKGVDVKLDDVGTGYGGFSYIQQLNIRSLKIDKMFVETIGTSDIKLSLLDSIIAFGREAGMEMIAEGVETLEQSMYLAQRGVNLQQGFYFGKPMNFQDFAYFCKSMAANRRTGDDPVEMG